MHRTIIFASLAWAGVLPLRAESVFVSGSRQVAVVELYTTEGCSSCPRAEEFLAWLNTDPRLWQELVPVASHVTYFDSRAWKDRFAAKIFTERQRSYVHQWSSQKLYTPCLVQNGVEWDGREDPVLTPNAGLLSVTCGDKQQVHVTFQPPAGDAKPGYDVYVAWLGGGVVSDVRGGENAGRKLTHEFIALDLQTTELTAGTAGGLAADLTPRRKDMPATPRRALAVWITRRDHLTPLQATGGWLN